MLIGEFQHNIDVKGRIFIPAKLREDLGEQFIVTKGLDGCLFVYSTAEWEKLDAKIRELPLSKARNVQRFLFSCACEVGVDKQGRVVIPASLRKYAGLTKEATIIGASIRAEIWDSERWQEICGEMTPDSMVQEMDELGF